MIYFLKQVRSSNRRPLMMACSVSSIASSVRSHRHACRISWTNVSNLFWAVARM